MYKMQDYIDAQMGGPGKGFYRIVKNPFQARKVINAGKMAVVMGIETSVPFGCTMKVDVPACSDADIDRQIDEVHKLGVRQMELVNKFDNALSGSPATPARSASRSTARTSRRPGPTGTCGTASPPTASPTTRTSSPRPTSAPGSRTRSSARSRSSGCRPRAPLYPPPDHCNCRGLTTLGEHTIKALAKRHMIFDPDHMSVKARSLGAGPDRGSDTTASCPRTRGRRRTPTRGSTRRAVSSRRTPATPTGFVDEVAHATSAGRTRATTSASASAPT